MTDWSIIIVNWNAADVLPACLDSLRSQTAPLEVIVVDNASTDASRSILAERAGELIAVLNEENLGFGRANNLGLTYAKGRYVLFLNPDTELVGPNVLEQLARDLSRPGVGLVGPRLVNADGSLQQSCAALPSVRSALVLGLGVASLLPDRARAVLAPVVWSHSRTRTTGWLRGAAVALRADVARELGGFSEDTFMYGEDLELCHRVWQSGRTVLYDASCEVMHHDDHSANQRWSEPERMRRVAIGDVLFLDNAYPKRRARTIKIILLAAYSARVTLFIVLRSKRKRDVYASISSVFAQGLFRR